MRNILFEWTYPYCRPRRWMAFTYYSAERNRNLFVAFPFNLLVVVVWWLQDRWARAAHAPSWIEREIHARRRKEYYDGCPF